MMALGLMTALVISNWSQYAECKDPMHVWLVVDYLSFIAFRLSQFAFAYMLTGPRQTFIERHAPNAIATVSIVIIYPFIWVWCVIGCVWYHRSGACLPESTSGWGFVSWLVFSFMYLLLFLWLVVHAYQLRNTARPEDVGVIEHMMCMLMHFQRHQGGFSPATEAMSERQISALQTRALTAEEVHDPESGGACACAICLADFSAGDQVRDISCRHLFHVDCLDQWLRVNHSCPSCRTVLTGDRPALRPLEDPPARPNDAAGTPRAALLVNDAGQ